jgi:hypothetical protein
MSTMTMEQLRDRLRDIGNNTRWAGPGLCLAMAASIDAHLTSREAKVDAVAYRYRSSEVEGGWVVFQSHARAKELASDAHGFIVQPLYTHPAAQEAAKPNEWERAVIEHAMVTEAVSIAGRKPYDIVSDIIAWHVAVAAMPAGEVPDEEIEKALQSSSASGVCGWCDGRGYLPGDSVGKRCYYCKGSGKNRGQG